MKYSYYAVLLMTVMTTFTSCSAEEQFTEARISRFNSEDIANGLAKGMGSIEFHFAKLFEYSTLQEAQNEIHKAVKGITLNAHEELAGRPDCNRAFIGFYVYAGKSYLTTVTFVDTKEGAIRENFVYTNSGIRNYKYYFQSKLSQQLFIDSFFSNAEQLFRGDKDKEALDNFLELKLQDPKTKGVAQFVVLVDAFESIVMGMP